MHAAVALWLLAQDRALSRLAAVAGPNGGGAAAVPPDMPTCRGAATPRPWDTVTLVFTCSLHLCSRVEGGSEALARLACPSRRLARLAGD